MASNAVLPMGRHIGHYDAQHQEAPDCSGESQQALGMLAELQRNKSYFQCLHSYSDLPLSQIVTPKQSRNEEWV